MLLNETNSLTLERENQLETNIINVEQKAYNFFSIIQGQIINKIGNHENEINSLNIIHIAQTFYNFLKKLKKEKTKIIVSSNDNDEAKILMLNFSSKLNNLKTNVYHLENKIDNNLANSFSYMDNECSYFIFFDVKKKNIKIKFYNSKGLLMSDEYSELFNKLLLLPKRESILTKTESKIIKKNDNDLNVISPQINLDSIHLNNLKINLNNYLGISESVFQEIEKKTNVQFNYSKIKKNNGYLNDVKAVSNSLFSKSTLCFNFSDNSNKMEIIAKFQKKFKFYTLNNIAPLYLEFLIKNKRIDNQKYIIKTANSSKLLNSIAQKYKIKVIETNDLNEELNKHDIKDILLATNGNNYFATSFNINFIHSNINNLIIFAEMFNYFQEQNKTLEDAQKEMFKKYEFERNSNFSENINYERAYTFFELLKEKEKINDLKIIKKDDFVLFNGDRILNIKLEDKTFLSFKYKWRESKLFTFTSIIEKSANYNEQEIYKIIMKEKIILNYISEFKEEFKVKKLTPKSIIKYSTFIILFSLIIYVIFTFIYQDVNNSILLIKLVFEKNNLFKIVFPMIFFSILIPMFTYSLFLARLMHFQGYKVKVRYLFATSLMGIVISNITPLVVGGDLIVYWYLRRKGYPKGPLFVNVLVSALFHQVSMIITCAIFIPYGLIKYNDILFDFGNVESNIIIIAILLGLIFNLIATVFMLTITLSKKFKIWASNLIVNFIEWCPFIISRDAQKIGGNFQYETTTINNGVKQIFNKWYFLAEIILYRLILIFLNVGAIFGIFTNLKNPQLTDLEFYWEFLVINNMIGLANSFSITPGGLGTSDWLMNKLFSPLFNNDQIIIDGVVFSGTEAFNILTRITFTIIPIIISAIYLFITLIGEWRIDKYEKTKRLLDNHLISHKKGMRLFTRFYKITSILVAIIIFTLIILYYLAVFNKI
ncbi:MAG: lysylphosphatidylglycerol synthase domain-containing protein [Metamycoplasmataceae bacterium]